MTWYTGANAVIVAWLVLTGAAVLSGGVLPVTRWLAIHMFLLGAVSTAVLVWSEHFAAAVCHHRDPRLRHSVARLVLLNTGAVAVLSGVAHGDHIVAGSGATLVSAAVSWHVVALVRIVRRSLLARFRAVAWWYVASGCALAIGATFGGVLTSRSGGGVWHDRVHAAHAHTNLFGWVGFAVLGTLFVLWPTVLRVRVVDIPIRRIQYPLWTVCVGLTVAVGGMLANQPLVAGAGMLGYAIGVAWSLDPFLTVTARAVRRRQAPNAASVSLAASVCWLVVALTMDAILLVTRSVADAAASLSVLFPPLLVGFVGQVLVGALTFLLPVVLGGAGARPVAIILTQGWRLRALATNVGVMLVTVPLPAPATRIGWVLALGALAAFAVLAAVAIAVRLAGEHRTAVVAGVTAGIVLTATAVVVGVSGQRDTAVTVDGGGPVAITLRAMRIEPAVIHTRPGTELTLRITNRDNQRHDLRLANGVRTPMLDPGETATLRTGRLSGEMQGWCTVAGHRAAGMTMVIRAGGDSGGHHHEAAAPAPSGLNLAASPGRDFTPHDATLPPAPAGQEHRVEIRVREVEAEVAPGVRQKVWTFNGTVPGPVLRGKVGDTFVITFVNDGSIGHGIDFHAGSLAPDGPMRTIQPGQSLVYRFRATHAGVWLYHCSTAPMTQHMAAGMYGAVVIDPPDLPRADREYLLVTSELYLGAPGSDDVVRKLRAGQPDGWMFNGVAAQYDHAPLTARVGERVRIWVVNAGPGSTTAFHVIGGIFDTVYQEGAYRLRPDEPGGAQVLGLAPAQGGFVELTFPEAGRYPFVDHDVRHAEAGAHGIFEVAP